MKLQIFVSSFNAPMTLEILELLDQFMPRLQDLPTTQLVLRVFEEQNYEAKNLFFFD